MFWGQKGCSVKDLTGYFHSSIVLNWKRLLILFPYHYVLSVLYFYEGGGGIEAQYCMHGGGQQGNTMDTFVKYSKVPILIANR